MKVLSTIPITWAVCDTGLYDKDSIPENVLDQINHIGCIIDDLADKNDGEMNISYSETDKTITVECTIEEKTDEKVELKYTISLQ